MAHEVPCGSLAPGLRLPSGSGKGEAIRTLESLRLLRRLGDTERQPCGDAGCKILVTRIVETVFNSGHELGRARCG